MKAASMAIAADICKVFAVDVYCVICFSLSLRFTCLENLGCPCGFEITGAETREGWLKSVFAISRPHGDAFSTDGQALFLRHGALQTALFISRYIDRLSSNIISSPVSQRTLDLPHEENGVRIAQELGAWIKLCDYLIRD